MPKASKAEMHTYLLRVTRAEFDALLTRANRLGRSVADVLRDLTRRVEREDGIGVRLQVVNAVLKTSTANMKGQAGVGLHMELEEVHVFILFDRAADGSGQRDFLSLSGVPSCGVTLLMSSRYCQWTLPQATP